MRGEHITSANGCEYLRWIIPACAGSTSDTDLEKLKSEGSSPHARGALRGRARVHALPRDHPRMRGEHEYFTDSRSREVGIIPACAGSTPNAPHSPPVLWGSSPHARGALSFLPIASSAHTDHPRMRGEHCCSHRQGLPKAGIIPACAGSTSSWFAVPLGMFGSSPHARGAPGEGGRTLDVRGDHPRMRGEHRIDVHVRYFCPGIIPACAGSTPAMPDEEAHISGSSPHARGALPRSRRRLIIL